MTGERQDHPIRGSIAKERVIAALEETMVRPDKQVHDFWKHRNHPDPRTAAFLHVIERVAESCTHHGIFP